MSDTATHNPSITAGSAAELADAVRQARAQGTPIVDYGIEHSGLGNPPPAEHTRLRQRAAASSTTIEHYQRDMTLRASAGVTIGDLQATLRHANQFLPVDADDEVTLGEVVVHNMYGPLRVGYGSVRDLLLGLSYIDGEGRDVRVGGRTVKNVAGYDVTRFMVGSLGELGLVHEAILRTYAVPEMVAALELAVDDPAAIDAALSQLLLSEASPAQLRLRYTDGRWTLRLGYMGRVNACGAQMRALESLLDRTPALHITGSSNISLEVDQQSRAAGRSWRRGASALVKLVVPPARCGWVCHGLVAWAEARGSALFIDAMAVHGCVFAGGALDAAGAIALDQHVGRLIAECGAGLRAWYARPQGALAIEPFAPRLPEWPVMLALKRTMDPQGILNPGRLLPVDATTT